MYTVCTRYVVKRLITHGEMAKIQGKQAVNPSMPHILWDAVSVTEGHSITLTCAGNIGKPPGTFIWQKRNGSTISDPYRNVTTESNTMQDTCTYYGTSNLTIEVTDEDDKAVIRCSINNSYDAEYYKETKPLDVKSTSTTTDKEDTTDANKEKSKDVIPVIVGVGGGVAFLLVIVSIGYCLYRRKRSNSNDKEVFRQDTVRNVDDHDSVHLDKGNGIRNKHAESQSQHNLAYSPNDTEKTAEENINTENDTQGLDTRNEYATVNEAKKLKNRTFGKMPVENQRKSNQDDMEDPYMESKDNTYAHLGKKHQHKNKETTEMYAKAGELTDRL